MLRSIRSSCHIDLAADDAIFIVAAHGADQALADTVQGLQVKLVGDTAPHDDGRTHGLMQPRHSRASRLQI
jgi:hypothetical protein